MNSTSQQSHEGSDRFSCDGPPSQLMASPRWRLRARKMFLSVALIFLGCAGRDQNVGNEDTGTNRNDGGDGSLINIDGASTDVTIDNTTPPDGRQAFCEGSGPPIIVGDGTGDGGVSMGRCTGSLAATSFRFAICTCEGLVTSHALTTDAFDSSTGMSVMGTAGSVGSNGPVTFGGAPVTVGGSLWVSNVSGITTSAVTRIGGQLQSGGSFAGGGSGDVGLDAFVNGNVAVSDIRVARTLTIPDGANVLDTTPMLGSLRRAPVTVSEPCDCEASRQPDIASFIAQYATSNDNAAVMLSPTRFDNVSGVEALRLPCGRFYLARMAGGGAVTLQIEGRVALFIGSDLSLSGGLSIQLSPGAEIDLFVGGNVNSSGALDLGNRMNPSRVRLYVAGTGTINLSSNAVLAGNVYAPRAELVTAGPAEVFGSVFVRRLAAGGPFSVHYDSAILRAGDNCPMLPRGDAGTDAGRMCGSCRDCNNQACINGTCGACTNDGQCCAPLVCFNGECVPEIP